MKVPGLRTARHSSGVRWSGYDDVMVFLEDVEAEVPKRALMKGIEGIDLRVVVVWGARGRA